LSQRFANVLVVFLSTIFAILVAEAVARAFGLGKELRHLFAIKGSMTRTVDGVALWDCKDPRCTTDDLRRASNDHSSFTILGLGDSIMYGVGQAKEQTYLEEARHLLASRSQRSVEILNLAVPGYNTRQEDAVYKAMDDRIKADLVLLHYWEDDGRQYHAIGGYIVDLGELSGDGQLVTRALPLPPRASTFLLVHSDLYALLTQLALTHVRKPVSVDWSNVSESLERIHERARGSGGRLLILASPELDGASAKPNCDLPLLREFVSTRGIEIIDLSDWLRGVDAQTIAMDGCHFNAEGHRIIAQRLTDYLLEHDLKASN
jgi:hypothetical protein